MEIEIRRLGPNLLQDYLHFFDETPHSTNKAEHRCYCVCWCSDNYKDKDFSTAAKRRTIAVDYVIGGNIQGYLAYHGKKVVGWCNANTKADCLECCSWQMFMRAVTRTEASPCTKVKSVFCFAIAPEMRSKGLAGMLLSRVCEDAKRDGFDFVEAYPNKEFRNTEDDFMGPVQMYKKAGFSVCYEAGDRLVMRRRL